MPTWDEVKRALLEILARVPGLQPATGILVGLDVVRQFLAERAEWEDWIARNVTGPADEDTRSAYEFALRQFPIIVFGAWLPLAVQYEGQVLSALVEGRLQQFRNVSLARFRPTPLDPAKAAELAVRGFLDTGLAYAQGRVAGLDERLIAALFDAARSYQSESVYTRALFRGVLSLGEWAERMDRLGVRREDYEAIIQSERPLAGPGELLRALFRGELSLAEWRERMLRLGYEERDLPVIVASGRTLPDASLYTQALFRGELTLAEWRERVLRLGYEERDLGVLAQAGRRLLEPAAYVTAAFRRHLDFRKFVDAMHRLGLSDEDIETLVVALRPYPTPSDLVSWQAREVFEPESVRKYGLDEELDRLDRDPFYRAGMDDEQIRNYWIAHWEHPPFVQVATMLQRDILLDPERGRSLRPGSPEWRQHRQEQEREVWEWFRLVEIPPYWRDKLIRMVYAPLTRVDARRMWDLGVLDDDDLMRVYLDLGYDEENARRMVLWTKLYERVPDIVARYRNGWIGENEVLSEIEGLGADPRTARRIYETKIKAPVQAERVASERDLTKTEIIKGVKVGLLSVDDAVRLLMDLGYDEWEAQYIVAINVEAGSSPETPAEFERLTALYRRALGQEAELPPKELLAAERRALEAERALAEAEARGAPQEERDRLRAEALRARAIASEMRQRLQTQKRTT